MRIVAEGVETEEQLASLQALGCDRSGIFNRQTESAAQQIFNAFIFILPGDFRILKSPFYSLSANPCEV